MIHSMANKYLQQRIWAAKNQKWSTHSQHLKIGKHIGEDNIHAEMLKLMITRKLSII
jgi:hypothetical protein